MVKYILVALVSLFVFIWSTGGSVEPSAGISAPESPVQFNDISKSAFSQDEYQITPMAEFEITARILSKKKYTSGRETDLSTYDLALGWGRMSDIDVINEISIRQSGRWYRWQTKNAPIPLREIERSSANMHMIAASDVVADTLKDLNKHDVVTIKGYLVNVLAADGWRWKSSLSRDDTGAGACELIWVESIEKEYVY
ncbi:hypothetical protein [Reinekea sp.]|jgi:hypothetical protein|uniref:hypothetical protein n=1 Tax=Reinekea sp. TaxID=1970455 RepID=UPI003988CA9F